jgi:hypothetical protein
MRDVEVSLNSIYEIRKNKITNYDKHNSINNNNHWLIYKHYTHVYAVYVLQALSTPARNELNLLNAQLNFICKNHQIYMEGYLNFAHAFRFKPDYFRN